jgi:Protein of unknown function (DUF2530)
VAGRYQQCTLFTCRPDRRRRARTLIAVPHDVRPLDPPMTPFAIGGIIAWAVAAVILLGFGTHDEWLGICVAGFLLGFPGLAVMLRHDANRRRRLEAESPPRS